MPTVMLRHRIGSTLQYQTFAIHRAKGAWVRPVFIVGLFGATSYFLAQVILEKRLGDKVYSGRGAARVRGGGYSGSPAKRMPSRICRVCSSDQAPRREVKILKFGFRSRMRSPSSCASAVLPIWA